MNSHENVNSRRDTSSHGSGRKNGSGQKNESGRKKRQPRRTPLWARAVRSPWTVACVVAAVVVGPSAATASALDRANAAPPHSAPRDGSPMAKDAPGTGFVVPRRPVW
ncbi:hypothetical protein [Streptomyces albicerus]|uniref:hypothetical protein n=1 Tax=Streptomyces albicerus TaxID=2569859 RepID=UPI00124AF38F|nr:hypothetical protein [Streptomyces albicerus]